MIICKEHLEIDNLSKLKRNGLLGIYKKWILQSKEDYDLMCDCLEKINFSSQDLKQEIPRLNEIDCKSIVYIITLTDWILGAYSRIMALIRRDVIKDFRYLNEDYYCNAVEYFKAIRSLICAHPTKTTAHPKYGFDGNYICADIRDYKKDITFSFVKKDRIRYIDFDGLHEEKTKEPDFFLYVYAKSDTDMKYYSYIGVSYADIYNAANVFIDKVCELDGFLSKAKKEQYVKGD